MHSQSQSASQTDNKVRATNVRSTGSGTRQPRADVRVSLAPLDPETALRGLLATPPSDDDDH